MQNQDAKTSCEKLNVPHQASETKGTWASASRDMKGEKIKAISHSEHTVPNVTGMGLRDAIYLLETRGLQVKVIGRGSVSKQSIVAGAKINKGQLITIELS
ncbi:MAG TPA: PASTA domain-containing protein [Bacteroidia bacterium]|nr:PASTA domain-containing protein [Bacteroidia bacterium]